MSYEVTRFEKHFLSFGGNHGHDRTQHATQPSLQRLSQWWISSTIDLPPRQPPQCRCGIFYCSAPTEQIQREVLHKVNKTPPAFIPQETMVRWWRPKNHPPAVSPPPSLYYSVPNAFPPNVALTTATKAPDIRDLFSSTLNESDVCSWLLRRRHSHHYLLLVPRHIIFIIVSSMACLWLIS